MSITEMSGEISRSRNYQSVKIGVKVSVTDGDVEKAKAELAAQLSEMLSEFEEAFLPQVETESEPKNSTLSERDQLLADGWKVTKNPNVLYKNMGGENHFVNTSLDSSDPKRAWVSKNQGRR
jgi:hypothetical protein